VPARRDRARKPSSRLDGYPQVLLAASYRPREYEHAVKTVAYCSPLVPPEWIEAHGLRPRWIVPRDAGASTEGGPLTGMCPYARAIVDTIAASDDVAMVVLTTACDQMRRGAGILADHRPEGVSLLNVPSTRESASSRAYYISELERLGRRLVELGGCRPSAAELREVMVRYDQQRERFRRGEIPAVEPPWCNPVAVELAAEGKAAGDGGVALGLVGGPLRRRDLAVAREAIAAGGRIVLDATEGGRDALADRFDPSALARDPFDESVRAYFDAIPAVFDRPNDRFHAWLAELVRERGARGLVCVRHVWCDLWRGAMARLKETAGVPILEIDLGDEDRGGEGRLAERLEAMIESLR
jgi:benzoyl-CoA reductase/2-hydroxyglutaryl-CoA dehydratase subunit BcrC/BadD/HgdB